jgi:hypothetical protein
MLSHQNPKGMYTVAKYRMERYLHEAHRADGAGLRARVSTNWLTPRVGRVFSQMGWYLIRVGRRLECPSPPPFSPTC